MCHCVYTTKGKNGSYSHRRGNKLHPIAKVLLKFFLLPSEMNPSACLCSAVSPVFLHSMISCTARALLTLDPLAGCSAVLSGFSSKLVTPMLPVLR